MWRRSLVLIAMTCAVSLYSIEATHFHHTLAEQLQCPAGHAVGHSPGNVFTPVLAWDAAAQPPDEAETAPAAVGPVLHPAYFIPRSHAPPSRVS